MHGKGRLHARRIFQRKLPSPTLGRLAAKRCGTRNATAARMNLSQTSRRVVGLITPALMLTLLVGCSSSRYERSTGEFVDDKMLDRRVNHALNAQPVYKYPDVHVHTYRGVVQLGGFVATEQQRAAASEIARRVRGVTEVENAISIANLQDNTLQSFIPGRENDTNNVTRNTGAPVRDVGSSRGGASSSTTTTNKNGRVFNGEDVTR